MSRIIIIGSGIIGLACAFTAQRAGHQVTLIGPSDPDQASLGNAGHIATEQTMPLANWPTLRGFAGQIFPRGPVAFCLRDISAWLPFGLRYARACTPLRVAHGHRALEAFMQDALPAWQRLDRALNEGVAHSLLDLRGIVKLWEGSNAAEQAAATHNAHHGTAQAVPCPDDTRESLASLLPGHAFEASLFRNTAHIRDLHMLASRLRNAIEAHGGRVLSTRADPPIEHEAGVFVRAGVHALNADYAIIAGGAASARLCPGRTIPMIAERGYHIEWAHGHAEWTAPNLVFADRNMVLTRFGQRLRATSFVEFGHVRTPPDPRKWAWLEQQVTELALPVASAFSRWSGARPTLPDYLPAIGAWPDAPRIIAAFGHNHLGLTLAARTAEAVLGIIDGTARPDTAFRPDRFTPFLPARSASS